MELQEYDLNPQQQLAVALYLKSMSKTQAATDAGYNSSSVFNNPTVKAAIADQLKVRAERLRIGGDWVLQELVKCYHRATQAQLVTVQLSKSGEPEGVYEYDSRAALQALTLIGKHLDVKAFDPKQEVVTATDDAIAKRLAGARHRVNALPAPVIEQPPMISLATPEQPPVIEPVEPPEPPVSFLDPQPSAEPPAEPEPVTGALEPASHSDTVTDLGDDEALLMLTPSQKLDRMLRHVSTHPRER